MSVACQSLVAYEAPTFELVPEQRHVESAVAVFVATIAVILAFFITTAAWCWFVCRNNGGVRSCNVGWFSAKATCRR